jgi:hypothetical protein
MRSMLWQLGKLGITPVFAFRPKENKKNLCRVLFVRWGWQVLPKRLNPFTKQHGVNSLKTIIFILTAL